MHIVAVVMSPPRSLILGLDVSPRRIGWAVVNYDDASYVKAATSHTKRDNDLTNRRDAFTEIARTADSLGDVCAVILEDAYAGPNQRGTINHALSVGNVEAFAIARWPTILVERINAPQWRRLCGLPARGKEPVSQWAANKTGHVLDQDASDAFAIAVAAHKLVWEEA